MLGYIPERRLQLFDNYKNQGCHPVSKQCSPVMGLHFGHMANGSHLHPFAVPSQSRDYDFQWFCCKLAFIFSFQQNQACSKQWVRLTVTQFALQLLCSVNDRPKKGCKIRSSRMVTRFTTVTICDRSGGAQLHS